MEPMEQPQGNGAIHMLSDLGERGDGGTASFAQLSAPLPYLTPHPGRPPCLQPQEVSAPAGRVGWGEPTTILSRSDRCWTTRDAEVNTDALGKIVVSRANTGRSRRPEVSGARLTEFPPLPSTTLAPPPPPPHRIPLDSSTSLACPSRRASGAPRRSRPPSI